jgi:hypothetical protein
MDADEGSSASDIATNAQRAWGDSYGDLTLGRTTQRDLERLAAALTPR